MSNHGREDGRDGAPGNRRPMPPSIPARGRQPERATPERRSTRPASQRQTPRPSVPPAGRDAPPRRAYRESDAAPPRSERPAPRVRRKKRRPCRTAALVILLLLAVLIAGGWLWANSRLQTVDALSGAADTPGDTYLIVGSDARDDTVSDGTTGARTDTIMLLHKPESGPVALISIPRDSYVEIPGHSANKINASFAFGGAPLLVDTVEELTGFTVDHYLEVGFSGVAGIVDAVDGVEICYDRDVDDWRSRMQWEAGCHQADGETALAFSRMRYSDPLGDIGRTMRQQQVVSAVASEVFTPSTLLNPVEAYRVADAGFDAVTVSEGTSPFDLARAAFAFNAARGEGAVTGTPPIASMGHSVSGVGSTVLLDPDGIDEFWRKIGAGEFEPGTIVGGID